MSELDGRTALVTGAGRGIGRAIARRLARGGATLALADIDAGAVDAVAAEIGPQARAYSLDITDESRVEAVVSQVISASGGIDILVNNAAITGSSSFPRASSVLDIQVEHWRRMIDVNLTGAFICAKHVCRDMVRRHQGAIVNIASIQGVFATRGSLDYACAKAGLIMLTRGLAGELSEFGIRVNAVAPGPIDARYSAGDGPPSRTDATLLGRVGTPDEVAEAVYFLASDRAAFIDGEVLMVDGGGGVRFREQPRFERQPEEEPQHV